MGKKGNVVAAMILCLMFLSGCWTQTDKKKETQITQEEQLRNNFKKFIKDINSIEKKRSGVIPDGIYIDVSNDGTPNIELYSFDYFSGKSTDEIDKIAAALFRANKSGKISYIVLFNKALLYSDMLSYTGPQDFGTKAFDVSLGKTNGSITYPPLGDSTTVLSKDTNTKISLNQILPAVTGATGEIHPSTGPFAALDQANWKTANYPLGAAFSGKDATFAVYSKNAEKVLLEIYFNPSGENAKYDYWMEKGADNIWRAKIALVSNVVYYGFRVWGPNWPYKSTWKRGNSSEGFLADYNDSGDRFNPNKVIFDPYGKEMSHDKSNPNVLGSHDGGMYGTGADDYRGIVRRNFDTGKWAPKSILFIDNATFGTKPGVAQKDAIIYEAHVRGLTQHQSSAKLGEILTNTIGLPSGWSNITDQEKGTYKAAGKMAKYLKSLGYTTIELLPVHETDNDANPDNSPGGNFWGYMTYSYFSPDKRYSSDKSPGGPTREFKEMVTAFHNEGMEVYLDVVYNHTGEGGTWTAPEITEITNFRGFDNQEYYSLVDGNKASYWETTGCGNNFRCDNPPVRKLILDSLTYWLDTMGVDGFRFDLAPVLGRVYNAGNWNFDSNAKTLTDIASLGTQKNAEMIAEAWDIGGSFVSQFPGTWGDWNGDYRDTIRKFIKGGGYKPGSGYSFGDVFYGTYNGYMDNGGPHKSVNFVVAHDGFTLADLVSYNGKNNDIAWPFGKSDGGNDSNQSWDNGGNQAQRRQQIRNLWTIQMLSRGVPMTVYGDEFGRTQNGNNNPYNIDSVATWNNYDMIKTDTPDEVGAGYHNNLGTDKKADGKNGIFLFANYITNLRKAHTALRQDSYAINYIFKKNDGINNISDSDRAVWIKIEGSSIGDSDFLVFVNTSTSDVSFNVPAAESGKKWVSIVDTAEWAEANDNFWPNSSASQITGSYGVKPWSVTVLEKISTSGLADVIKPVISNGTNEYWGVYNNTQSVTITCDTPGAEIRYTLDGSDPSVAGTIYNGAISLTANGGNSFGGYRIRAVATKAGMNTSQITEKRFTVVTSKSRGTYGSDVMLQGFHWSSWQTKNASNVPKPGIDTYWYDIITAKSQDIKDNFQWVWFPPVSRAASDEGYLPVELQDYTSQYGDENKLKAAISAINPTKAIADIVINHRSGSTGWGDYKNPTFGDTSGIYRSIAYGDEGFSSKDSDMKNVPDENRGWGDTGANYDASRDIDHTNIDVQKDIVTWMNYLKNTIGFKGWRYDFVKGYSGQYAGYYDAMTNTDFSVGELWADGEQSQSGLDNWVSATERGGYKSMIFDFSLKDTLNNAFGWHKVNGQDSDALWDMSLLKRADGAKPAGYIGWRPENAVTFVDNHDTGSTQGHWMLNYNNVYLAYVFTLTHPGVPCVAWDHFFDWSSYPDKFNNYALDNNKDITTLQEHIKTLIKIRKENGLTQTSNVVVEKSDKDEYAAKIDDKIAIKIGGGTSYNPGSNWGLIYFGTKFAVWKNGRNADLSGLTISTGTLSPAFSATTTAYSATVASSVDQITITPSIADTNGNVVMKKGSTEVKNPISLNAGINSITIEVSSADGTLTKSYTVTVTRDSEDATLKSLVLSGNGTWDQSFDVSKLSYTYTVINTPSVTVTPVKNADGSTIKVNGNDVVSGTASNSIALDKATAGQNTFDTPTVITVLVTNGTSTKTYTITVKRREQVIFHLKLPTWANDSAPHIAYNGNGAGWNFDSSGNGKVMEKENSGLAWNDVGQWCKVTADVRDSSEAVIFQTKFWSGSKAKILYAGNNFTDWKSYTTNTANIWITAYYIFDWSGDSYYLGDSHYANSIDTTPPAEVSGATATSGKSKIDLSWTNPADVDLAAIEISNSGGTKQIAKNSPTTDSTTGLTNGVPMESTLKTIDVWGNKSAGLKVSGTPLDISLKALSISTGTLTPAFATDTLSYTATVANSVDKIKITPTKSDDATTTIKVNNGAVDSGNASGDISLTEGENIIDITVSSTLGGSKSYTLKVTRKSGNANLSGITLSAGTLAGFDKGTIAYNVGNTINSTITISAVTEDTKATYVLKKGVATVTNPVNLDLGVNTIEIVVSAEDSSVTKTYTITVTRDAAPVVDTPVIGTTTTLSGNGDTQPDSIDVTITCALAGASIYYTIDGNPPTILSTPYNGTAFSISNTATIKAIAVKSGYTDSVVAEKKYTKTNFRALCDAFDATVYFKGDTAPLDWTQTTSTGKAKWTTGNHWYFITWEINSGTVQYKTLRKIGVGGAWEDGTNHTVDAGNVSSEAHNGFGGWSASGY